MAADVKQLVTKKDLKSFGTKLKKELIDLIDVKFAEYFELMTNSLDKTMDKRIEIHNSKNQESFEKINFELLLHNDRLNKLEAKNTL